MGRILANKHRHMIAPRTIRQSRFHDVNVEFDHFVGDKFDQNLMTYDNLLVRFYRELKYILTTPINKRK